MGSQSLNLALVSRYGSDFSLDISKTRNGAVQVRAEAADAKLAAEIANGAVRAADSIKQRMLRQNVGMRCYVLQGRSSSLNNVGALLRKGFDSGRCDGGYGNVNWNIQGIYFLHCCFLFQ